MKKLFIFIVIAAFLAACSQGAVEKKDSDKAQAQATEQTAPNPHGDAATDGKPKERKYDIPAEVLNKYKGLTLQVKNLKENTTTDVDVMIGQKVEVKGTPLTIELEHYLPDFVISAEGTMTTRTADEKNPAAKIKVLKMNEVYFDGWLFQAHPEEHGAFKDDVYGVTIVKSITK